MLYRFGEFELDTQRYELRRAGIPQALEPQGFNVLRYLVEHHERVVAKDELMEHLWPDQHVSEATLTQRLMAARRALGDDGRSQRYIRTVHGRGYRFVATIEVHSAPVPPAPAVHRPAPLPSVSFPPSTPHPPSRLIGRDAELAALQACFAQALQGHRQCVFLTGEAGIGKTTLADAFVAEAQRMAPVWIGYGQCVEHYGAGEAYLPLLEALGRLGRTPGGSHLGALLRRHAPSWLVHLPGLAAADAYDAFSPRPGSVTRERMVRELAEVLESLTATQPLLLVLEDLHWSDASTVDWLSYVARRRDPAQLCIIGTYRPSDALVRAHPVHTAVQEMQRQGHARTLALPYWSVTDVSTYLTRHFGPLPLAPAGVQLLHRQTQGNPFFLTTIVDTLEPQHVQAGGLLDADEAPLQIPASVRRLIEAQLTQLPSDEQAVLETASVAGEAFATATVAVGLEQTVDGVETCCTALARRGQFVRALGVETWPDGTIATRYGFMHALYQEVLYERLAAGRRLRLHQRMGQHKEGAYGTRATEIAAELAEHFVRGQDAPRAIQYLRHMAETAARRYAHHEVIAALSRALTLLTALPSTPEHLHQELEIHLALGPAFMASKGMAAPEVEHTYARARALCAAIGDTPRLFPTLRGLCQFYITHGALHTARELGEQLYQLAQRGMEATHRLEAHCVLGRTLFNMGEYAAARTHLAQGIAHIDPVTQRLQVLHHSVAPGVHCLALMADVLWCQGYPVQAIQRMQEALALAQSLAHPYSQAWAHYWAAFLYHRCRDASAVQAHAEMLLAQAATLETPLLTGYGTYWLGWAGVQQGQARLGLERLQQGITTALATRQGVSVPFFLVLQAEAMQYAGQNATSLRLLEEALLAFEASGSGDPLAEAYRLQGASLLCQAAGDGSTDATVAQAEACFQHALTIARRQQAKSWELRAAMSLSRLWQQQGKGAAAHALLAPIYGWFTEGLETTDLREARVLLAELEG